MKKHILFLLLFFFSSLFAQYGNNLISNGDFESGVTGWFIAVGTGTFTSSSDFAYSGIKSLKLAATSINFSVKTSVSRNTSTKYRMKAYVKSTAGNTARIGTQDNTTIWYDFTNVTNTSWTEIVINYITTTNNGFTATLMINDAGIAYFDAIEDRQALDTLWVLSSGSDADNDTVKTLTEAFVTRGAHSGGIFIVEARDYGESITIDSSFSEIVLTGNGTFKTTKIDFNNKSMIIPYDLWIGTAQKLNYNNVIIKIDANTFLKYRKRRWGSWNNN